MKEVILLLAIGRLIIWLASVARPTKWLWNFFDKCDWCLGMWVFTLLAGVTDIHLNLVVSPWPEWQYVVPALAVDFLLTGMVCTTAVHLMVAGFKERFYAINVS